MTRQYINELVTAYPSIREVWLFGSRANGTEHANSDWDYLVFGDDDRLLNVLCQDLSFNRPDIDLFIVATPTKAMKPWNDGDHKVLKLDDEPGSMAWHDDPPSATKTIYTQTKEFDPPTFEVDTQRVKAVLVYRRLMWD